MSDDGDGEVHDEDDDHDDHGSDGDGDDAEVDVHDDVEEENRSQDEEAHLVRACAVEMHLDMSQEPFCVDFYRKMPHILSATPVLCEPAQSTRPFCAVN